MRVGVDDVGVAVRFAAPALAVAIAGLARAAGSRPPGAFAPSRADG